MGHPVYAIGMDMCIDIFILMIKVVAKTVNDDVLIAEANEVRNWVQAEVDRQLNAPPLPLDPAR